MEIEHVEVNNWSGNFELVFHLSDGNVYRTPAFCDDYMSPEDRELKDQREQEEETYLKEVEKEEHRKNYYKKMGWKYIPKYIPAPE